MRIDVAILAVVLVAGACGPTVRGSGYPGGPAGDVVIIDDDDREGARQPRLLRDVPPGHYPPPGECRIWYLGRPAGQQPPPARCDRLVGRVPYGAFVLYNGKGWDSRYDWRKHESRNPGSVPGLILRILTRS